MLALRLLCDRGRGRAQPLVPWASLRCSVSLDPLFDCLSNTGDQLRRAHNLTTDRDDAADDSASIRIQPPFVSCITLFGDTVIPRLVVLP